MRFFHRSRFSDPRGALGMGLPREELWGVAESDLGKPRRRRGEAARARRRAKRAAAKAAVTLKAYLRRHREVA